MRRKGFKGRTEKKALSKSKGVVKLYDEIQSTYADILQSDSEIVEIRCNVFLDGLELGEYTSDFVCAKVNGDVLIAECVQRKHLTKPMTVKMLDASREYWLRRGVADWRLIIDAEK